MVIVIAVLALRCSRDTVKLMVCVVPVIRLPLSIVSDSVVLSLKDKVVLVQAYVSGALGLSGSEESAPLSTKLRIFDT